MWLIYPAWPYFLSLSWFVPLAWVGTLGSVDVFLRPYGFCSILSKRGTSRADNFLISKSWCKTLCIRSDHISKGSAISLIVNQRSSNTVWCTKSTLSLVVAVFGRSERFSSITLVRPHLYSATQFLTVSNEGRLHRTQSLIHLLFLESFPLSTMNFIIERYLILSIVDRQRQLATLGECHRQSRNPNGLKFLWFTYIEAIWRTANRILFHYDCR